MQTVFFIRGSGNVRYEIRKMKLAIKERFPDCKLNVKYIKCHNYALSGDKIQIKTDIPYEKLTDFLWKNTERIAILKKGDISYACSSPEPPVIFGFDGSEADFIEIEEIPKGEELWKKKQ